MGKRCPTGRAERVTKQAAQPAKAKEIKGGGTKIRKDARPPSDEMFRTFDHSMGIDDVGNDQVRGEVVLGSGRWGSGCRFLGLAVDVVVISGGVHFLLLFIRLFVSVIHSLNQLENITVVCSYIEQGATNLLII